MKCKYLKILTAVAATGVVGIATAGAWTVAMDEFTSYEEGVAVKDQVDHGGVGFAGDWTETASNAFWTPLYGAASGGTFDGTVVQDNNAVVSGGGRHMRALSHPQSEGVVYASALMTNIGGPTGSSQFHLNSDTPILDGDGNVQNGLADLIGGVRYDNGVLQIIDTSFAHVPDDPETEDVDESRNLDAVIPGKDGFTDDDPPEIAYNEYWRLAETYVDIAGRDDPIATDILWVMKYDLDASTISYYAFLPGDDLMPEGASYSVEDHPVNEARNLTLGAISVAAWGEAVAYEYVRVGSTMEDVVPVNNKKAMAAQVRSPIAVDGTIDDAWMDIPAQSYGLKHGDGSQPADAADASGTWRAAWDADNLYLLFEVTDDEHIDGPDADLEDQIEFWTDTNLARNHTDGGWPPVYDNTDTQWITRFIDGGGNGFANRWQHASSALPSERKDLAALGIEGADGQDTLVVSGVVDGTSKVVEVSVGWEDLGMAGPPVAGQLIGFETQLNDRDESTGTDPESGDPVFESNGKAAWADGNNRAWISPSSFGVVEFAPPAGPLFSYDFADLTVGETVGADTGAADDVWAGPWVEAWLGNNAAVGAEIDPYVGDLVQGGTGIKALELGRLSRTFNTTFDSGVVWTSFVIGNDTGSTQFWLGDTADFDANDSSGIVAGVRMHNGSMQVVDPTLASESRENYVNTGVYPNEPVLVVTQLDYENQVLAYWIFESGLPIEPGNPSAFYEVEFPRPLPMEPFSGIAWAGFFSNSVISNLRVGDELAQVIPGTGIEYNCPILVNELHQDVTLDGSVTDFAWERTNGLEVKNFFSDGGANVTPVDAADYTGVFHTGWYEDTLYLAVIVDDEAVRNVPADGSRDSVEIYLDGDNNDSESLGWPTNYDEVDDFQLIFALNADREDGADITGSWFGNPTGNPDGYKGPKGANDGQDFDGISWNAATTETGYILEIALDMTVVPGLDTFVSEGLMGLDVAIVDNDGTGELDEEENEIAEKSHHFFCDDANWDWNGTAHFGTAYVAPAMPAVAMFGDGSEDRIQLEGDASAGSATIEVNTNFTDVAYVIAPLDDWVTIDFDPMVGAGEVEFSWSGNTGLDARDTRIQFSEATGLNRIDLLQEGNPEPDFDQIVGGEDSGDGTYLSPWFGRYEPSETEGWIRHSEQGWLWNSSVVSPDNMWLYSTIIEGWAWTSEEIYPVVYDYTGERWVYFVQIPDVGFFLFDYAAGEWTTVTP